MQFNITWLDTTGANQIHVHIPCGLLNTNNVFLLFTLFGVMKDKIVATVITFQSC